MIQPPKHRPWDTYQKRLGTTPAQTPYGRSFGFSSNPETNCNITAVQQFPFVAAIGGSGGMSNCTTPSGSTAASCSGGYTKPSWQVGPGVPADGKRDLPDVSLFAGDGLVGTSYVVCELDQNPGTGVCSLNNQNPQFLLVGGTSASVQVFAGVMAMVEQRIQSTSGLGLINPTLYTLAAAQATSSCNSSSTPAASCIFNDTTKGTIAVPCENKPQATPNCNVTVPSDANGILTGFAAGTGFDLATGLGSMNVTNLANAWATSANPADFTFGTPSPTSQTVTAGNSATYTIAVNPVTTPDSSSSPVPGFRPALRAASLPTTRSLPAIAPL